MKSAFTTISTDLLFLITVGIVFSLCFFMSFPCCVHISDEVSYINRTLSFCGHDLQASWTDVSNGITLPHILANYPLGTSFVLAPFYKLLGYSGLHLANLFYLLVSFGLIVFALKQVDRSRIQLASYLFLCLPILFFSRTVMSELPSLLMVSAAFYFYFHNQRQKMHLFYFALFAGLSIWFREANAFIFLLPLVDLLVKKNDHLLYVLAGGVLGIVPRLLSAAFIYGDAFYLKDPGYTFSLEYLPQNLPVYAIIVMFLIPGMLYPILQFKSQQQKLINGTIWLYLLVHLLYGYNGIEASGTKALLLSSRFLIPVLPLIILSFALLQNSWIDRVAKALPWLAFVSIAVFHIGISIIEKPNVEIIDNIKQVNSKSSIFIFNPDSPEMLEVLTPIQATAPIKLANIHHIDIEKAQSEYDRVFLLRQHRGDTPGRQAQQLVMDEVFYEKIDSSQLLSIYAGDGIYQKFGLYELNQNQN